ncbi:hypothetical protein PV325_009716 [Microctonus aethiopoides]|nr:hypothetical protein PV325_009716 [Microctonus aethiopoides]
MRAAVLAACLISFALGGSPRLPRTSADQRSIRNANINNNFTNILPPPVRGSQRSRWFRISLPDTHSSRCNGPRVDVVAVPRNLCATQANDDHVQRYLLELDYVVLMRT